MQNHFLCPNHRQWLLSNPAAALSHLIDSQDTGQFYREQGALRQALPYLGSAYETAEIILGQHSRGAVESVIDFTSSAIVLADNLQKIGQITMSAAIYQQALQRLKPVLAQNSQLPKIKGCILDCLKSLTSGANFSQHFIGVLSKGCKDWRIH